MSELTLRSPTRNLTELPRSRLSLRYRFYSRLSHPTIVNLWLKIFGAKNLSQSTRLRWQVAGLPEADFDRVLPTIRSLDDWGTNWYALAEQRDAQAQVALRMNSREEATQLFLQACALYNISGVGLFLRPEHRRMVAYKAAAAYAQSAAYLNPPAQRVEIPFDGAKLAGYLRVPTPTPTPPPFHGRGAYPIVMLVNGAGTVKEELRLMEDRLLEHGLATLSVDGPGMGESWDQLGWTYEQERVAGAKLNFLETVPQVDLNRVGLFGVSLGGLSVLRMASHLNRFKAVAAVCAPYDGPSYFHLLPYFVREVIRYMSKLGPEEFRVHLPQTSLRGHVRRIRCPMLLVGAGKDVIVPGGDAHLILQEATCEKELIWYPHDEHSALNHIDEWPGKVAQWLAKRLV